MEHYGNMEFATKKELFKFLSENKDKLIAQKRAVKKEVDCSVAVKPVLVLDRSKDAKKAGDTIIDPVNLDVLKVVCIINTTNFLDCHGDVHIPGLWNKSLQENKMIMHLQEHEMEFDKIIADGENLKAYTKPFTWSELGYSYVGNTEALVFESEILRKRNEYMMNQYANGWVRNHSVGMYYVKMDMAINDPDMPNYYEAWNKYYPQIANKEVADERGYFWYVLEAKCIEGSAVPLGSNTATPTLDNGIGKAAKQMMTCPECGCEFDGEPGDECPDCGIVVEACKPKNQPLKGTDKKIEPSRKDTQKIDYKFLIKNIKN
jgi:hypothetical protein